MRACCINNHPGIFLKTKRNRFDELVRELKMNKEEAMYAAYVSSCLHCDPDRRMSDLRRTSGDPELYKCITCDRVEEKGVLLNSRRSFLNNVG
jgi:hypothetical protein